MILSEMKSSKDAIRPLPEALFRAQNAQKSMSAGASPQTPLGKLTALPPDPLTGFKGPTSKGKGEGWGGVGGTNRPPHDKILATPLV